MLKENIHEQFDAINLNNKVDVEESRRVERVWNVLPSDFSLNTTNPIRAIVEHLAIEPNPEKSFIPLSVGECNHWQFT